MELKLRNGMSRSLSGKVNFLSLLSHPPYLNRGVDVVLQQQQEQSQEATDQRMDPDFL